MIEILAYWARCGHVRAPENTYTCRAGGIPIERCRECQRGRTRRYWAERRYAQKCIRAGVRVGEL